MRKHAVLVGVVAVSALFAVGCGGGASKGRGGNGGGGSGGDGGLANGGDGGGDNNNIDPGGPDFGQGGCSDAAKLVYVVDENNTLSSFAPDKLQFTNIGTLACPAQSGATPFSMAVDRNAVAWVLYSSGELFHVDTSNAKCTATSYDANATGFVNFGMGFVSNSAGSTDETLFIAGTPDPLTGAPGHLAQLDTTTFQVKRLGMLTGSPELTGTGDAKLWGFFPDASMPRVTALDKVTAAESNKFPLSSLAGAPMAWAFAFWGGDWWIFLQRSSDPSTTVWHLKANGALDAPLRNTGRKIVGAGVSTCAPTQIG